MAMASGSFHDWLVKSSYVYGRDQTSAVVNRKKVRAHRKTGNDKDEFVATTDRENNEALKISKRRYRRWLNERLLRELTPPLEASEIASLFAPPPWGEKSSVTPLERVTGAGPTPLEDAAGWEPFRQIDMDVQAKLLEKDTVKKPKSREAPAMEAWKQVERSVREALRRHSRSPLLEIYEEKLLMFLSEPDKTLLCLEVEDPQHRLLLHGLSQFHGLTSKTLIAPESGEVTKPVYMLLKKRRSPKPTAVCSDSAGTLKVTEFLRQVQHRSQIGLVC